MKPGEDDPLLNVGEVLDRLAEKGRRMARSTWTAHVARGEAPKPKRRDYIIDHGHARPRWRTSVVDEYAARKPKPTEEQQP